MLLNLAFLYIYSFTDVSLWFKAPASAQPSHMEPLPLALLWALIAICLCCIWQTTMCIQDGTNSKTHSSSITSYLEPTTKHLIIVAAIAQLWLMFFALLGLKQPRHAPFIGFPYVFVDKLSGTHLTYHPVWIGGCSADQFRATRSAYYITIC